MRILIIILFLLLAVLQGKLWLDRDGFKQALQLRKEIAEQKKENTNLVKRNKKLGVKIRDLKQSRDRIEEVAREKLGMVKSGEIYYQFTTIS